MRSPSASAPSTYGRLATIYATLAHLYSGGAIQACQRWGVQSLPAGARVLFAGSGPGTDVVQAAQAGLRVTAVDCCPAMLEATSRRAHRAGVEQRVELVNADLLRRTPSADYDVVIAQFFLNVFAAKRLPQVLGALAGFLRPGGRLVVGDFAPMPGGRHPLQRIYHDLPMHGLARLGANDVHNIHDLPAQLQAAGFTVRERRRFRLFGIGPGWIEGLVAERESP
jgi:demethylmenaquinone methyltransferase/2-methoxy-6-polyprenyl-1,4-benzoquinol methylase